MIKGLKRSIKQENESLQKYMSGFISTTWYQLIKKIDLVGNQVLVRTTASLREIDKLKYIANVVYSWANDKSIHHKQVVKFVVILDQNDKRIIKIRNPLSKKYFKT